MVGVLIGLNIVFSLIWLAISLGYSLVKIPMNFYKEHSLFKRRDMALYKVAKEDEKIVSLLYEKKRNI